MAGNFNEQVRSPRSLSALPSHDPEYLEEGFDSLKEWIRASFEDVYDGPDALEQELSLMKAAKRLNIPLEDYRILYSLRHEKRLPAYPKPIHWTSAPSVWTKWFFKLPKGRKRFFVWKGGLWLVKQSFFITMVAAAFTYVSNAPTRQRQAHYQA
ncbi:hypothetical protein [Leptolyngbya sp. FACHB-711]|uniref:hypothetical protein n=1 Tax=Leptolyngbya sp. FACHB-711 TaxID=2692813 RepID=UPI00168985C5|nr:hypothetical protein [Leptolyngbya sp. FACHB-711]MBD1848461.1 hypothetical protein [Cyanobacteria bacterium FACHB-502]MBD2028189.1 hypothetical protein [Leptolyngbya sp. FACHB-711]